MTRIGVVAPACPITPETAGKVASLAAGAVRDKVEIAFHPQCFLIDGHFAGSDAARTDAFLEVANSPDIDAVWFARGGYGSCRLEERAYAELGPAARAKTYLGYSDLGLLLGRLLREGVGRQVHGPMANDITREGGAAAVARALAFLVAGDPSGLEPTARSGKPCVAFNLTILVHLLAAQNAPDLSGRIVMLEEISEHHYRIDRSFFALTSNPAFARAAGVMLGRCRDIPENDRAFGRDEEEIARYWCGRAGIAYLGRADIGHDADNKIVPFGAPLLA
jgi:muramoyltetrapeptide carboxypeptidase